jgi:tetratricopeptide (TPR) repeat protein
MPVNLVYQLALTRAEAGQYDSAFALFKDRFFAREEGGISSDQVLFEVELMRAEADAASGNCEPAEAFLIKEASSPETTKASRTLFKMAGIARQCGKTEQAQSLLKEAGVTTPSSENLPWIIQADEALGTGDIAQLKAELSGTIPSAERLTEIGTYSSRRWYAIGFDQATLGNVAQAETSFRNAFLLPDSFMSHHLARAGLASLQSSGR